MNPTTPTTIPTYTSVSTARTAGGRTSHLLSLTWAREWPEVLIRCQTNPQEATNHNSRWYRTPLHLAMFAGDGCRPRVLIALLKANKHAVIKRDKMGYTPLHYACQFGAGRDLCLLLIRAILEVEMMIWRNNSRVLCSCRRRSRRLRGEKSELEEMEEIPPEGSVPSPMYLACKRNAPIELLKCLIEEACKHRRHLQQLSDCNCYINSWIAPLTGAESSQHVFTISCYHEFSPLEALWDHFPEEDMIQTISNQKNDIIRRDLDQSFISSFRQLSVDEPAVTTPFYPSDQSHHHPFFDEDLANLWDKILYLLQTTHEQQQQENVLSKYLQNTTTTTRPTTTTFSLLHSVSALRIPIPGLVTFVLRILPHDTTFRDPNGQTPLHHAILSYSSSSSKRSEDHRNVIQALLNTNPDSAKLADVQGNVPMALAIQNRIDWNDGIRQILDAAPNVLWNKNPQTHLFPFMMAAVEDWNSLDTVYELMRAFPQF